MTEKFCGKCKTTKPTDKFSKNNRRKSGLQTYCKVCANKHRVEYFKKNRAKEIAKHKAYKFAVWNKFTDFIISQSCIDCGETDPAVLDLDHVKGKKRDNVSTLIFTNGASWKSVEEEIDKCEVRCANCHRRKTAKERGWQRAKMVHKENYLIADISSGC